MSINTTDSGTCSRGLGWCRPEVEGDEHPEDINLGLGDPVAQLGIGVRGLRKSLHERESKLECSVPHDEGDDGAVSQPHIATLLSTGPKSAHIASAGN